jgi:hypothetical protein
MGGSGNGFGGMPMFEEEKMSNDMIEMVHGMFSSHPFYTCLTVGIFIYAVLCYVFM